MPLVIRLAVSPLKSAKIRCTTAQPIPTASAGAFMVQSGENEGRTAETRSEHGVGIGCMDAQRLQCYRDQIILEPNSSWADERAS